MSGIKPWVFRSPARFLVSYLFRNPARNQGKRDLRTAASQRHLLGSAFMDVFFLMGGILTFCYVFYPEVLTLMLILLVKGWNRIFCIWGCRIFGRVWTAWCSDSWNRVVIVVTKASRSYRVTKFGGETGFGVGYWSWTELTEWCFEWRVLARVFRLEFMAPVLTWDVRC